MNGYSKENVIDPSLERLDPTPNICDLFRQFDKRFFWNALNMVEVSWSGRQMTSCAGICSFQPKAGYCRIRLSAPLLSLRPRKDLVETLLHEMIHAYLFMTRNNKDRSDHGPEFHKHMFRINEAAGTNITVYHTFRDEVKHLQGHVWRCSGPCQKWGPFYGIVRRATNRAPGPNDRWWDRHSSNCSGSFIKIEEPQGYKNKNKTKVNSEPKTGNLRNYFTPIPSSSKDGLITQENGKKKGTSFTKPKCNDVRNTFGSVDQKIVPAITKLPSNIHTFGSINSSTKNNAKAIPTNIPNKSNVHTLGSASASAGNCRNLFNRSSTVLEKAKPSQPSNSQSITKLPPATTTVFPLNTTAASAALNSNVRDHVRNVWANKYSTVSTTDSISAGGNKRPASSTDSNGEQLSKRPKTTDDIILECPACDKLIGESELAVHLKSCKREKHLEKAVPGNSQSMLPCPVCNTLVVTGCLDQHLTECLDESIVEELFASDLTVSDENTNDMIPSEKASGTCPVCTHSIGNGTLEEHISDCLNESFKEDVFSQDSRAQHASSGVNNVACPICGIDVLEKNINTHIDECLNLQVINAFA